MTGADGLKRLINIPRLILDFEGIALVVTECSVLSEAFVDFIGTAGLLLGIALTSQAMVEE